MLFKLVSSSTVLGAPPGIGKVERKTYFHLALTLRRCERIISKFRKNFVVLMKLYLMVFLTQGSGFWKLAQMFS